MGTSNNKRDYAIDLLRFICILMVVTGHYFLHGGLRTSSYSSPLNILCSNVLCTLSRVAVNVFFIITGFFSFKKQSGDRAGQYINALSKSITLDIKMIIYGVMLYLAFSIYGLIHFDPWEFATNFLPLLTNRYWFITTYICLIVLLPFISNLSNYNNKEFFIITSTLLIIDSILPLLGFSSVKGIEYSIFHAISMAVIGMSIAKFELILKRRAVFFLLIYLSSIFIAVGLNVICPLETALFAEYNSVFVVISSAAFFCFVYFLLGGGQIKNSILFKNISIHTWNLLS